MTTFDLVVLGDCNPDLILTGEEIEPRFGQAERLAEGAEFTIGGSASIVACGAARLGLRTALISVVGGDLFGHFMIDSLAQRGVITSGIRVDPARATGVTVILDRSHDRAILTFPGTIAALGPDYVDRELLSSTRHVHVSSFFLQTALVPGLSELLRDARRAGASTSIDPNWDPTERWDGGLRALLRLTDVFLPNRSEATNIAQERDPGSAARSLAEHAGLVAVKLGAEGALAADRDGQLTEVAPLLDVHPVDAVGAGDSFDAGMLAGLLHGWTTRRALELGCACGGLSMRAAGGTGAQPSLEEALEALGEPA